jgi:hypothetical protein
MYTVLSIHYLFNNVNPLSPIISYYLLYDCNKQLTELENDPDKNFLIVLKFYQINLEPDIIRAAYTYPRRFLTLQSTGVQFGFPNTCSVLLLVMVYLASNKTIVNVQHERQA